MRVMIHGKASDRKRAAEADTRPAKRQRQDFYVFASVPKLPNLQLEVKNEDISINSTSSELLSPKSDFRV